MLAPEEFTAGTFASAPAGSLILPRNKHEASVIVGLLDGAPTALFLGDRFQFQYFPTAGSENWSGLIIPNVRVEIDESTAFDAAYGNSPLGTVVRAATQLSVYAKAERSFGHRAVPLVSNLPATYDGGVGFTKWHVVLGAGAEKRILLKIDVQTADQ
ncbi:MULTISPECIES: hypothetical protein [Mesorhizobium]|uniref:hypothetical protein n=1 Tax=Mesorhizobium TaxID=68287 RepID=UPI0007ECA0D4|nr:MULTISPECIES: hypothetical protein [Mesorhizobium]PBB52313.1 hypothetical protein CK223_29815 [Mesorhizobium loti]QIA25382.1 hypothetical protein A9K68_029255 [Mesorhizobium sp. AA22]